MKPLVFFHGLEGKPTGHKGSYLADRYPGLIAPELSPDLEDRLEVALEVVKEPSVLVGSSLGALTALMFAQEKPELVLGLVLLAPALRFLDPSRVPPGVLIQINALNLPEQVRCEVIGALQDEVVDPEALKCWVASAPDPSLVRFEMVEDNHGLGKHLEHMNQAIKRMME